MNPNFLEIDPSGAPVIDTFYGIKFVHDFPYLINAGGVQQIDPNFLSCWNEVYTKYDRRITRLKKTLLHASLNKEKVIFFREGYITKEEAIEIQSVIKNCYPLMDFLLVIFTYHTHEIYNWELPGIINQETSYLNLTIEEHLNRVEWKKVLIELNLIDEI